MKKGILLVVAVCYVVGACGKGESGDIGASEDKGPVAETRDAASPTAAEKPTEKGPFAAFDADGALKAIQGSWKVEGDAVWKVEGNNITITNGDKVTNAELDVSQPGEAAIIEKSDDGSSSTEYIGYTRNGEDMYIGMGRTGVRAGDTYMVSDRGVIVYDGKSCGFYKKDFFSKQFKKTKDLTCSVSEDGKTFNYQKPAFGSDDKLEDATISVIGTALLNEQAQGNKAEKM